ACPAAPLTVPDPTVPRPAQPMHTPLLVGHRGAAGTAPENTVCAFRQARSSRADFFELDVQLSADGVPFAFHDDTPARTTDAAKVFPGRERDPITSFTWAELQRLEVGSHFSASFHGERIPHLDDAAAVAGDRIGVFIEVKSPENSPGIEQVLADALQRKPEWQPLVRDGRVEVLGYDAASNRAFAALAPEIPLQQLADEVPAAAELGEIAGYAHAVGIEYRPLDAAAVQRVKAAGLSVGVYTVDSPDAYDRMVALGVDRITGDFPVQLARHVQGSEPFPDNEGLRVVGATGQDPDQQPRHCTRGHVVLHNTSPHPVDASGYSIRASRGHSMTVGRGCVLAPGQQLHLHTGPGTHSSDTTDQQPDADLPDHVGDSVALWSPRGVLQDTFAR
ncbi:glycerophosphodiester phosphodiesterase family protein, partial [Kocuria sp. APC 4018]